LSGVEEESSAKGDFVETNLNDQDLSNWLSGLDNEPGLPFEPMPTPNSIMAGVTPASGFNAEPVVPKSDLPDWLSDIDSAGQENLEDDQWKKSVELESTAPASVPTDEPAPVSLTADLPDWLQGVEEEPAQELEIESDDDLPPWMHREQWEADEPQPLKPTSPSDWHPAEVQASQPAEEPLKEEEVEVFYKPVEPTPSPTFVPAVSAVETPVQEQPVSKPAPVKKKTGLPVRRAQPEALNTTTVLNQAKGELDRGDIPTALDHYGKLIKKGKHLEETIRDLSESLYRYPVEVGIWQTLGDAYMRSNRLKEALEAYNKAEELIR
jgi:tetratricopeptide (TPR) repeat protein